MLRSSGDEGEGGLEGNHKDLLRLFKDYVIPGKEEGFIVMLREVLATRQNTLGASTATELNNLRTTIETLAKTVKEALPGPENTSKKIWVAVAKGVYGTSKGAVYMPKVVIPEQ
ncbi:hypothetical protein OIDMADRAFT_62481 [Oidiodendron maius Zn]|uniref:Uncharacterized protein n=1 Tax=Oidiodendron maius (strain Zn) TaxID=913774 RepID=A0A0C3GPT1_OIDMZ|nr:hypothetical protein OIDMADRAFT_62481 [Oidiodendron maius Zn]